MSAETALLLALTTPLLGAVLIAMSDSKPNQREAATLLTAGALFAIVISLLPPVLAGQRPALEVLEILPGLKLAFVVEPLGMMFALIASGLWLATSVYSIGYMRANKERNQTRYYVAFAVALAGAIGVAFAANMLTLFLAYEVLTLSTYPLVTHHGTPEAVRGGRIYLGVLLGTSIGLLLVAIVWTWQVAGTLDFTAGGILEGKVSGPIAGVLVFLYMFGIGKAALMPVHRWLPAAMVAPTPVSALLHAVAVVKAGVFTALKVVVYIFGVDFLGKLASAEWLVYVAGATIIIASIIALRSDNLKRRLAYSTVSQLSYIIMAAALYTKFAVIGAALHIVAHAFGKITLFFAAGSIYTASGKTKVSQLAGIGRRMPWTMGAFAVGAVSLIGLPPTVGFISKWYIVLGAFAADNMFVVGVILVSTLLNAAYFLPIVYTAFFRPEPAPAPLAAGEEGSDKTPDGDLADHGEAPLPVVIALLITALGAVLLFFFPQVPLALAHGLAAAIGGGA